MIIWLSGRLSREYGNPDSFLFSESITAAFGGGFGNVAPGRCALAGSSREIILRNPITP
jgi:hypothetical protein